MGGEGGEIKEESAWAYALHGKWYWSPLRPPIQLPTASPQLPPNFTWQRDGLPPSTWISTWISCPVSISASLQSTSSSALTSTIMLECTSMTRTVFRTAAASAAVEGRWEVGISFEGGGVWESCGNGEGKVWTHTIMLEWPVRHPAAEGGGGGEGGGYVGKMWERCGRDKGRRCLVGGCGATHPPTPLMWQPPLPPPKDP